MNSKTRSQKNLTLGDALKGFIEVNNLSKGLDKVDAQKSWFAVMGNAISAYTDDVFLQDSTLVVRLSSSALRQELSYAKDKIVRNLNEHLGKDLITDVRFS